ncbi:6-hydroxymethylpterin diphosphokinase MptE-like protein [Clostridium sp. HBUAS56017]|uniref:6-hydroxymethylpterin diphosphokinase MptE-like protein n=1 Tax=Clostridium sp. HBUAS56017 TaxID=2571128 RepID=UPI00117807F6|nr:6-hydroxymethylpterin diphosphokinase MptE-like protein [Clostridium sp. HBUAS56017]
MIRIEDAINVMYKISNIRNKIKFKLELAMNKDLRIELSKNSEYKGLYKGKRCFILGNGPSLNKQDLSKLENEYVFTVNFMNKSEIFHKVKSNWHVAIDPCIFNSDGNLISYEEKINTLRDILSRDITLFTLYDNKGFLSDNKLLQDNVRYMKIGILLTEKYNKDINFLNLVPEAQTVVQAAIYLAIYMGFSEIYLLGCDMTGILQKFVIDDEDEFNRYGHVYKESSDYQKKYKDYSNSFKNEEMLACFKRMFEIYRKIEFYSRNREFKIYNATQGGALDVFKRIPLEDILK